MRPGTGSRRRSMAEPTRGAAFRSMRLAAGSSARPVPRPVTSSMAARERDSTSSPIACWHSMPGPDVANGIIRPSTMTSLTTFRQIRRPGVVGVQTAGRGLCHTEHVRPERQAIRGDRRGWRRKTRDQVWRVGPRLCPSRGHHAEGRCRKQTQHSSGNGSTGECRNPRIASVILSVPVRGHWPRAEGCAGAARGRPTRPAKSPRSGQEDPMGSNIDF